tara:strand:- start:165 stop:536 length:372 start_codon:yes stop_codon:yes gene_type:complete
MLTTFNKITLIVSTIILIITLIFMIFYISDSLKNNNYPPVISDCPDYWDIKRDDNDNIICQNNSNINKGNGISNCNNYNIALFNERGTTYDDIKCAKYNWAKKCNLSWSGVTNDKDSCKDTTI